MSDPYPWRNLATGSRHQTEWLAGDDGRSVYDPRPEFTSDPASEEE